MKDLALAFGFGAHLVLEKVVGLIISIQMLIEKHKTSGLMDIKEKKKL